MNENEAKPWFQSRTIIGALVSLLCTAAGAIGYQVAPELQGEITGVLISAGAVAGAALSIYGRLKATRPISAAGKGAATLAVAFLLLGGLAFGGPIACASAELAKASQPATPAQRLYAIQADYNSALAAAVAYAESDAADPNIKAAIASADRAAYRAIGAAQSAVRSGDDATIAVAIAAAGAAVSELSRYLALHAGGGS